MSPNRVKLEDAIFKALAAAGVAEPGRVATAIVGLVHAHGYREPVATAPAPGDGPPVPPTPEFRQARAALRTEP